jgi:hypothetical protein
MNQIPEYVFELQADQVLQKGMDNTWRQDAVGTAWVFSTGQWRVSGNVAIANRLYKQFFIPADEVMEVTFYVTSLTDIVIEISFFNPPISPVYPEAQGIFTQFIKGNPSPVIVRARVATYANVKQAITITTRDVSATGPIPTDVTVSGCTIIIVRGARRAINAGTFKSLNFDMERSAEYWGAAQNLSGSITIVGEDWLWLREKILARPALMVFLKVNVSDGVTIINIPPVVLDTINFLAAGDGHTYKAELPLLKESQWSQFLSYFDQQLSLDNKRDADNLSVIDGYPVDEFSAIPPAGKNITLTQKFLGYAEPTGLIAVPADSIMYVGFSSRIVINDNFNASKGVSGQQTLVSDYGQFATMVGEVRLFFTSNGMNVEAVVNNTGAWIPLVSGVALPINVPVLSSLFSNYVVRVRNNTGAVRNFSVTNTTDNNYLNITCTMRYNFFAVGYRPILALKHYIARAVGEYDNIDAPIFDTKWQVTGNGANGDTAVTGMYNPPVYSYRDFNSALAPSLPIGNIYTGGENNWLLSGATVRITAGNVRSNLLTLRGVNLQQTYYIPKGTVNVSVTISVLTGSGNLVRVYGVRGLQKDLLGTIVVPVIGVNNIAVVTTKYYDAIGIELHSNGAYTITVTAFTFTFVYATTGDGKYALTFVCNGKSSSNVGYYGTLSAKGNVFVLKSSMGNVFKSLRNLFGLAVWPTVDPLTGTIKINVDEVDKVFTGVSALTLYLQDFEVNPDPELIYDVIRVGGIFSDEFDYYGDASSTQSNYTSQFLTSRKLKPQEIPACLNTPIFISGGLSDGDLLILDMLTMDNTTFPVYRLDDGLVITGSLAPLQPNWLHAEGRIMRRNQLTIFAGGSEFFTLLYGKRSNDVRVDFVVDPLGPIADRDPIIGASVIKPFAIMGTSEITLAELVTLNADVHKEFTVMADNIPTVVFIKRYSYNFASGKLYLTLWPKTV